MVSAVRAALEDWRTDDDVRVVAIDGAGERGLCAGGDVVAVRRAVIAGESYDDFFVAEYAMNAAIATYPKPVAVLQDGIVMGGGVGVSGHAGARWATATTRMAMPETGIGFFPDVGALHLLAAAPGELGTHLALTGAQLDGADAVALGFADAVIDPARWPSLVQAMGREGSVPTPTVADSAPSSLLPGRSWIDECYTGDDASAILDRLREHADPRAQAAGEALAGRSPYSVCVTLEALRRAARMTSVEQVLEQDVVLARSVAAHPDFAEGVRAQLVDKDRAPRWQHADVASVPRAEVLAAFDA